MTIKIIIPTYNERQNIQELIQRIFNLKIENLEVIFIDDGSPDNTAEEIKNFQDQYPVRIIQRGKKLGLGSAYIAGFKEAVNEGAGLIFEMDADLSHSPEDIPRMIEAAREADLIIGSRKIPGGKIIGWNCWRHLMSNGAMFFARIFLKLKTKDVTSGFRCYRSEVLKKINLDEVKSNGYAFQEEMLFKTEKLGFRVKEIAVTFNDRARGKSKLSTKDILEFFKVMIKLR